VRFGSRSARLVCSRPSTPPRNAAVDRTGQPGQSARIMAMRRDTLRFNGWGRCDKTFDLRGRDSEVWAFVSEALEVPNLPSTPALPLDAITLPPVAFDEAALASLRGLTDDARVHTDAFERSMHAVGRSYYDLVRIRRGELTGAPDAVVYPRDHDEVMGLLRWASHRRVSVVPYGGGSSVVGGVEAVRGRDHSALLSLDTSLMDELLDVDEVSHTATFQAGIYGPELERKLEQRGLTLGHYPQSFEFSTLGGWIAARGAGQQSNRYGTAVKLLAAARVATPTGELRTRHYPASAAGPDLNAWIAGSEGTLGVITEATMKVHPRPESRDFISFLFRDWESGVLAVRSIVQGELPVATLRLSDVEETRFFGAFRSVLKPSRLQGTAQKALSLGGFDRPCVLMVGFEGPSAQVGLARRSALVTCTRAGGLFVGRGPGNSWYENRFEMPYLRDPLMDHGVGVDTLETSTSWSNLHTLYDAVQRALRGAMEARGHRGLVMAHISHSYLDGASLYFTYIFPRDLDDEVGQWRAIKEAASEAISRHEGTISHHHGVGVDHAHWLEPEKGPLALAMIDAAKARLDPAGVLNPGKLLPPAR
jgi:alkyldihydroxyacetonephosphate synthase